jgi:two-component system nitrate/nitrite response regulator NarL
LLYGRARPGGMRGVSSAKREQKHMIRVVIISHVSLYREGLIRILSQIQDVFVVGQAHSLEDASGLLADVFAEVVLVDLASAHGLEEVRALSSRFPRSRFLALGVENSGAAIVDCAEAGIAGYVAREGSVDDLLKTIRCTASGELRCSPQIAAALMQRVTALASLGRARGAHELTRRETQIVELVQQGLTNKEIALRLSIATATVRNHVHNILEKLGARTRGEAAAITRRFMG